MGPNPKITISDMEAEQTEKPITLAHRIAKWPTILRELKEIE